MEDIRNEESCADVVEAVEEGQCADRIESEIPPEQEGSTEELHAPKGRSYWKEAMEYVQALVLAVGLAVIIMAFIGQSFMVEGASMEPTLHERERVMVEKISYILDSPSRGDIVVLMNPRRPDQTGIAKALSSLKDIVGSRWTSPYIKRVIAVSGDTIQISDGVVYLNGEVLDEPYVKEAVLGDYGPVTVPEGSVFVMGDNRNRSDDSRGTVGFLSKNRILGRAIFRYYPINRIGPVR